MEEFPLGTRAKDRITGFVGTITARIEYFDSSPKVQLEELVDGKVATEWFDIARIVHERPQ